MSSKELRERMAEAEADLEQMKAARDASRDEENRSFLAECVREMEQNLQEAREHQAYAEKLSNRIARLEEHRTHEGDRWGDVFGEE